MSDHIQDEEDSNFEACFEAALRAGHSSLVACFCENGSLHCPLCPFKSKQEIQNETIRSTQNAG